MRKFNGGGGTGAGDGGRPDWLMCMLGKYNNMLPLSKTNGQPSPLPSFLKPLAPEGTKIKIRQFNFKLTFNGLICKGNDLSQRWLVTIVCFGDLWVNKFSVSFLQQLDFKNKYKPYSTFIPIRR